MAALLLLCYAAICVAIFKILRVPLNKWTVTTAGLGGVVIIGGLLAGMNYNHPYTTDARFYFYTTPIVPEVKGTVVEVAIKPQTPLKRGDKLFGIDPRALPIRRRSEEGSPCGSRAKRQAAQGFARPGDCCRRKSQGARRAGAADP